MKFDFEEVKPYADHPHGLDYFFDEVPYVDMNDQAIIKLALREGVQDNFRCYWKPKYG